jgi:hypothetical protein
MYHGATHELVTFIGYDGQEIVKWIPTPAFNSIYATESPRIFFSEAEAKDLGISEGFQSVETAQDASQVNVDNLAESQSKGDEGTANAARQIEIADTPPPPPPTEDAKASLLGALRDGVEMREVPEPDEETASTSGSSKSSKSTQREYSPLADTYVDNITIQGSLKPAWENDGLPFKPAIVNHDSVYKAIDSVVTDTAIKAVAEANWTRTKLANPSKILSVVTALVELQAKAIKGGGKATAEDYIKAVISVESKAKTGNKTADFALKYLGEAKKSYDVGKNAYNALRPQGFDFGAPHLNAYADSIFVHRYFYYLRELHPMP